MKTTTARRKKRPFVDASPSTPTAWIRPNVDHDGHGTHVAGTIASPVNGVGIAGVAPEATLVNIRAGQDSGYFFLGPTVDALTYSAAAEIDVVNMSFHVDPWLYNCPSADGYVDAPEGKPTAAGRPASWNATCTGTPTLNNFYGNGLVDADAAVALAQTHLP